MTNGCDAAMLRNLAVSDMRLMITEYEEHPEKSAYFGTMSVQIVSLDVIFWNVSWEIDEK